MEHANQGEAEALDGEGLRIGIVRARFNEALTNKLAAACLSELERLDVDAGDIRHVTVPGALVVGLGLAMLANLPANYVLIYGKLGFPAMGLKGAAIGTVLGSALSFLVLLAAYLSRPNRREFATHRSFRLRGETMRTLARFGAPAGVGRRSFTA
mgnify:CR=1 FL=1